jgi:hypothetical protein
MWHKCYSRDSKIPPGDDGPASRLESARRPGAAEAGKRYCIGLRDLPILDRQPAG